MRKIMPAFALGASVALLAGCASGSTSPAAAGIGGSVTTSATQSDPASASGSASPSAAPTSTLMPPNPSTPSTAKKPSATTPSTKPSSHRSAPSTAPKPSAPTVFGYQPKADAGAQIAAARAAAKADGREVLLDFGASWCGNCVAMDQDFHTSQVQAELATSYHLVQIDADTNMSAISPYDGSSGFGLPVLIVLSPSGSVRVDTNKSGNPGFDESGFLTFLKKWAQ